MYNNAYIQRIYNNNMYLLYIFIWERSRTTTKYKALSSLEETIRYCYVLHYVNIVWPSKEFELTSRYPAGTCNSIENYKAGIDTCN